MTGWRIGFAGASEALIKGIAKVQSQSTTNPRTVSQAAAVEALNGPQDFIAERTEVFKSRRDLVVDRLNQAEGLGCQSLDGAFYVYPSCAGVSPTPAPPWHNRRPTRLRGQSRFGVAKARYASEAWRERVRRHRRFLSCIPPRV